MDKDTRNRIQHATQAARKLLEGEFGAQLEGTFDIRPDGTVAVEPGRHLAEDTDALRVRAKLVEAVAHHRALGEKPADAVKSVLRASAFTTLNRFVALKMLEARKIVQECVTKGLESSGFKNEFLGLADGLKVQPDAAYKLYLECLFDEIGREVRVLFDRRDPASLLWPRRTALEELLGIVNDPELAAVWGEDETIGWVYQYFNGEDERRQMRAESQAPRNSRELAVRNQFFTPRYVVEFLTDNTLGRTWVEMQRGETRLMEQCRYLVRRPSEVFLRQGEVAPPEDEGVPVEQRTVYVPFRAKKDPREIRVLDPACGSGHFLLYSFDLLLAIYEEAWADPEFARLRRDFATVEALRLALPGLILRYNLHGVDIDPRAAQIAAMALWMRAQRAWNYFGVRRADRPLVTRTNVVVAEPMPGERDLLEEFCRSLAPEVAGLVRQVFEDMQLAGEAGTLLRIEETVREELRKRFGRGGLFAKQDAEQWADVEQQVYEALRGYAEQVPGGAGYRRRLFAEDAARGFAFIDVSRKRYDVVLMNPPFGRSSLPFKPHLDAKYPASKSDLYASFVERGCELSLARVGAITSRLGLFSTFLEDWRREFMFETARIESLADLGHGVLDDALVEAAAYVLDKSGNGGSGDAFWSFGGLDAKDKGVALLASLQVGKTAGSFSARSLLAKLPERPIAYWLPATFLEQAFSWPSLAESGIEARWGLQTDDNFRFVRLAGEVDPRKSGTAWRFLAKGGEYAPFASDIHLMVNWANDSKELRGFIEQRYSWTKNARSADFYFRPGLTYSERTTSELSVRVLPHNCVINIAGPGIYASDRQSLLALLALSYSRVFRVLLEVFIGQGDSVESGSAARHYKAGILNSIPVPQLSTSSALARNAEAAVRLTMELTRGDETTSNFVAPVAFTGGTLDHLDSAFTRLEAIAESSDRLAASLYGLDDDSLKFVDSSYGPLTSELAGVPERADLENFFALSIDDLVDVVSERCGNRRQISKQSYTTDRRHELIAIAVGASVADVAKHRRAYGIQPQWDLVDAKWAITSWSLGVAFGRFDLRLATGERLTPPLPDPFDPLPACSPGMLTDSSGLPIASPPPGYPIPFPIDGILVDDPGHDRDLLTRIHQVFTVLFADHADDRLAEAVSILDPSAQSLRPWMRRTFFEEHIQRYSKSRRKAPIYWRLGTPSGSYSVWIYLHRFNKDTLHRVLNDHVGPKVRYESSKLAALQSEGGPSPSPSQRRALADQETFVDELRALQDELDRVAPLWDPDLDDGVVINASFLHRLFAHTRAWQRECESHWQKLQKGEYDWAHLAMRLWPERVVPKCTEDRSLAIAHGLEDALWLEGTDGKWRPQPVTDEQVAALVQERTSTAVKDALRRMGETPEPVAARKVRAAAPAGEPKPPKKAKVAKVPEGVQLGLGLGTDPTATELNAVRAALHAADDGLPKAELLAACGLDEDAGAAALAALVQTGEVVKIGAGRGTRYRLGGEG